MNSFDLLTDFVMRRMKDEPIHAQIPLYRALADLTPDSSIARAFQQEAAELQAADNRQRELHFRVRAYASTKPRRR